MKNRVEVWAPATVANMNVGFDALGCALTAPGERMILHRTAHSGDVSVRGIHGAELDANPERNVATIAAKSRASIPRKSLWPRSGNFQIHYARKWHWFQRG